MDSVGVQVAVLLLIVLGVLVIGDQVLGARRRGERSETRASAFMEWLGLTALTLFIGCMLLFPGAFGLQFLLGNPGGILGLTLLVLFVVATPVAWAIVIRRRMRHAPARR